MSVIYVSIAAIIGGLIAAIFLGNLKSSPGQCGIFVPQESDKFNVCIRAVGHEGRHMCADGRHFS